MTAQAPLALAGLLATAVGYLAADVAPDVGLGEVVGPLAQFGGLGVFAFAVWQSVRDLRAEIRELCSKVDKVLDRMVPRE